MTSYLRSDYVRTPSSGVVTWFDGHTSRTYPPTVMETHPSIEPFVNSNMYVQKPLRNTEWTEDRMIGYYPPHMVPNTVALDTTLGATGLGTKITGQLPEVIEKGKSMINKVVAGIRDFLKGKQVGRPSSPA